MLLYTLFQQCTCAANLSELSRKIPLLEISFNVQETFHAISQLIDFWKCVERIITILFYLQTQMSYLDYINLST